MNWLLLPQPFPVAEPALQEPAGEHRSLGASAMHTFLAAFWAVSPLLFELKKKKESTPAFSARASLSLEPRQGLFQGHRDSPGSVFPGSLPRCSGR